MDEADVLKGGCYALGLQQDVQIVAIHGFRWTLDYEQSPIHPDFANNMIKLERLIQERTGRPVDLRLEAESDKNKRAKRNTLWKPA